jgi:hypothetical protein
MWAREAGHTSSDTWVLAPDAELMALRAKGAWEGREEKMPPAILAIPRATSSRVGSIS